MSFVISTFLLLLLPVSGSAQQNLTMPMASPYARVVQRIGLTDITITYHRPGIKGRKIWGGLVPYDQVWRAGANENTTISFSDPVTVAGKQIPAGTYGIHMIPTTSDWTIIFSSVSWAWGSFSYDQSEDVLRFNVKPSADGLTERLIYYFDDPSDDSVDVVMKWEKVMLRFPVKVNVTDVVLGNIRKELRGLPRFSWQGWYQAANYCLQNKTNLDQALQWVDRSISMNENFNNLRIKSDLLTLKEQHSAADELMKKALGLANEADLNTYGYQLMGNGDLNKAIEIFRLNIKRYPDSWNVYDSLGEALAQQGKTKEAIEYYEKALGMTTAENQKTRIENILKNLKSD
jgi:hypothetical protein